MVGIMIVHFATNHCQQKCIWFAAISGEQKTENGIVLDGLNYIVGHVNVVNNDITDNMYDLILLY